jgi:CheY-like chemotaxis protein
MAYVLVVDDALDTVEPVCALLNRSGHEAVCVPNGREALAAILARTPDIILLDLFMPEMDGASLVELLRSYLRLASLPVIVYTGMADTPAADRVRHLKVNAILMKGRATPQDVLNAVNHELPRAPG